MRYLDEFSDNPDAAARFRDKIQLLASEFDSIGRQIKIMEICGSHTMAIARYGIRGLLPKSVRLISGPGCPVCVTSAGYIDAAIKIAEQGAILATFGDMMKVPGSERSLTECRADGARINVCYSPLGALELAEKHPNERIVFLGVGFETTTAPITGVLKLAAERGVKNLSFLLAFKLVPPAIGALLLDPEIHIDAFLCPAHVSAIIGSDAYEPFAKKYKVPCVIAGFEALDLLWGISQSLEQLHKNEIRVENLYQRVVKPGGNQKARELIDSYLKPVDADWRGIGVIPESGLELKPEFECFDAAKRFGVDIAGGNHDPRCRCGDVLKGKIIPHECPMFGRACDPVHPIGPCMVSSEGSCAAYYKYGGVPE